ncbi:MAG: polysaccharide biosynthesis C-terminal domain-containing protein [Bacteroidales bacterium]|nr:polysaccharide biosynthesis C-terminal domain-containing protein [Candidatus Cacconaster merdequi]
MKRTSHLVGKAFRSYLGASIMTVAAAQIASIVDASIVGNLLGSGALAAVNICKPVLQAVFSISVLLAAGGTMLTGMAIGKGERTKADSAFSLTLFLTVSAAVVLTITGNLLFKPLLNTLCSSESIAPMAGLYLRIMVLSILPMMLMTVLDSFVTVDGDPHLATRAIVVSNAVNLCLDVVFIRFFGMGITGAGLATCIMYIVCVVMVLPHFRKSGKLKLTSKVERGQAAPLLTLGLPLFLSSILVAVQFACSNNIAAAAFGDSGLVAYAVCMQLLVFSTVFINGTYRTIQPVGSLLKGMGDYRGIRMLTARAYRFLGICLLLYFAVILIFPRALSALFGVTSESDMAAVTYALPSFSIYIVLMALLGDLVPIYQISGHKYIATLLSVAQALLPLIGFSAAASLATAHPAINPWSGFAAGELAAALLLVIVTFAIRLKDRHLSPLLLIPEEMPYTSLDLSVAAIPEEIEELSRTIVSFLEEKKCNSAKSRMVAECSTHLATALSEKGHARHIDYKLVLRDSSIDFSVHSDGELFNPLEDEELSASLPSGARYDRLFSQNILTINSISL